MESDPVLWNKQAIRDNNVVAGLKRLSMLAEREGFRAVVAVWPDFGDERIGDLASGWLLAGCGCPGNGNPRGCYGHSLVGHHAVAQHRPVGGSGDLLECGTRDPHHAIGAAVDPLSLPGRNGHPFDDHLTLVDHRRAGWSDRCRGVGHAGSWTHGVASRGPGCRQGRGHRWSWWGRWGRLKYGSGKEFL